VNLTLADLAELPLPAALFGRDSELIARTPEWRGRGPGTFTYVARGNRLLVTTAPPNAACDDVLAALLTTLDDASRHAAGVRALQVQMLAAGLRVAAGHVLESTGSSDMVVHYASAGIRARTGLRVRIEDGAREELDAPEVAALVLVQLAVNAERHAGTTEVTIAHEGRRFSVRWRGESGAGTVATSRRRDDRERWGLGFARVAADAIGGALYAPHDLGAGIAESTLEVGLGRLALPLAGLRGGTVVKATRAWDEETGLVPGTQVIDSVRLERASAAAHQAKGRIACESGWWARAGDCGRAWVAIPRDGGEDRSRDVIDGIAHERALWDGVAEPERSTIAALAGLLGSLLGTPLQRVPGVAWTRRMRELAPMFQLPMAVPECRAAGALDPRVTALLASQVGERFDVDGDRMWLRVRSGLAASPLLQPFPEPREAIAVS